MPSTTIGGFLADLDQIIVGDRAAHWDVHGLQLGDPEGPAEPVAVCHEVTEEVVEAVEARPPGVLVTYHPLLFHPTTRLVAGRSPGGRAFRLVRAGVAVGVVHTALDAAAGGTSDALAAALGLGEVGRFGPITAGPASKIVTFVPHQQVEEVTAAMAAAGGGRIGAYTACSFRMEGIGAFLAGGAASPVVGEVGVPAREPETRVEMLVPPGRLDAVVSALVEGHPYEEPAFDIYEVRANLGQVGRIGTVEPTTLGVLARDIAGRLGVTGARAAGDASHPVERVAVVPGSGGSYMGRARAAGADLLVTGDVSHHTMVEAIDMGMAVLDVGHTPGERPGVEALAGTVAGLGVEVLDLTGLDPRPW